MTKRDRAKTIWLKLRKIWLITGLIVIIGFTGWCFVAYRANMGASLAE